MSKHAKSPRSKSSRHEGHPAFQGPERHPREWNDKVDPQYLQQLRHFSPRNDSQRHVMEDIEDHPLTFLVGPAGTGKTVLPVVHAIQALMAGEIKKVVAVRPAIEAGDSVGYLTGDLAAKMGPYLRPVIDNFEKFIGKSQLDALMHDGIIEITSITYMRGRTVEDAVYIIDEAQNCTSAQLRMLLTRIGENARCIVTMDPTQCDIPVADSAIQDLYRFQDTPGIAMHTFTNREIVRSPIVKTILNAYVD